MAQTVNEWNSLSLQDREKVFEEVNGVSSALVETPELVQQSLADLDEELETHICPVLQTFPDKAEEVRRWEGDCWSNQGLPSSRQSKRGHINFFHPLTSAELTHEQFFGGDECLLGEELERVTFLISGAKDQEICKAAWEKCQNLKVECNDLHATATQQDLCQAQMIATNGEESLQQSPEQESFRCQLDQDAVTFVGMSSGSNTNGNNTNDDNHNNVTNNNNN